MSHSSRRRARRRQRRNPVRQTRERKQSVLLDPRWVAQLRSLSDRIAANVCECRSITEATAGVPGMPEEDAAELLERYVDDTDDDDHHAHGLLGWLAAGPGDVTVGVETPSGVQGVPLRSPAVETTTVSSFEPVASLVVEYPAAGSRVVVPTAMIGDGPERHYALHLGCDDSITDSDRRRLITETLDHLTRMLPGYRVTLDLLRGNAPEMRDPTPAELNAPGGAA